MHRRSVLKTLGATLVSPSIVKASTPLSTKPNFVFISIDDLNDWVSPLSSSEGVGSGYPGVITPNLQYMADVGVNCKAAYAPVPACSPSRTSTLLGISPDKTGVYFNGQEWSKNAVPGAQSIFSHFRENQFKTYGLGKLFHRSTALQEKEFDCFHKVSNVSCAKNALKYDYARRDNHGMPKAAKLEFGVQSGNCHWSNKLDELNAIQAVKVIDEQFSGGGCFLGLGLIAPHAPFAAMPDIYKKYLAKNIGQPPGFFPNSEGISGNLRDLRDLSDYAKNQGVKREFLRELDDAAYIQLVISYLSTITYADSVIGLVMDKLRSLNILEQTYIVVWSDHGMHMAEKLSSSKFTLWERSLRVPLLFSGPGIRPSEILSPVSLTDIYPTLCDLAKIDTPHWCTGTSLANSIIGGDKPEKTHAVSIYGRGASNVPDDQRLSRRIATEQWNYIHHPDGSKELYDRLSDPHEWYNLYKNKGDNADIEYIIASLDSQLPQLSECHEPVW